MMTLFRSLAVAVTPSLAVVATLMILHGGPRAQENFGDAPVTDVLPLNVSHLWVPVVFAQRGNGEIVAFTDRPGYAFYDWCITAAARLEFDIASRHADVHLMYRWCMPRPVRKGA